MYRSHVPSQYNRTLPNCFIWSGKFNNDKKLPRENQIYDDGSVENMLLYVSK